MEQHDFGWALFALRNKRERVCRGDGWNGKGMWLFYVAPDEYELKLNTGDSRTLGGLWLADNHGFIMMKTAQNTIVPWVASQSDMLAEDWETA